MKIDVLADADSVARAAASMIAEKARSGVAARGRFIMAVSGGQTPWMMLRALSNQDMPWEKVHVVQVDERVAPAGHPDRNLTHLRDSLLTHAPLPWITFMRCRSKPLIWRLRQHNMPRRSKNSPVRRRCSIWSISGLGLTAIPRRCIPGDPVLKVTDADVALTGTLSGKAPDDIDLSHPQSFTMHSVVGNREREGWNARPSTRRRPVDSGGTGSP